MAKKQKNSKALSEKEGVDQPTRLNPLASERLKKNKTPSTEVIIEGLLSGNKTHLSRALTRIESTAEKHQKQGRQIIEACLPHANKSIRIGVTGVPGV